jgi:dihydroorotate dehydrogenase electron transfer subunit
VKKFKNIVKNIKTKTVVLIAGGSGVASIIYLYNYLKKFTDKLYLFYGEKTKDYVIKLENFGIKNVVYSTDDGSYGEKGNIVEVFKKHNINCEFLFCCGPKPMIKSLQNLIKEKNDIKAYALMEEYMCCGVGVCRSCVVKIKSGEDFVYETVCCDGPLFDLAQLLL